jgi:hypothetical protein
VAEIAHVLSDVEPRVFRPIANDQLPANPLITMFEMRHREIFKVRNPIRSFHDKLVDTLYRAFFSNFQTKDTEMDQAGE